jgi:hypothetical protein
LGERDQLSHGGGRVAGEHLPAAEHDGAKCRCRRATTPAGSPTMRRTSHAMTVRVRATLRLAGARCAIGVVGEARRDGAYRTTIPIFCPAFRRTDWCASGEASLKMADLDGDGKREVIVADSGGLDSCAA